MKVFNRDSKYHHWILDYGFITNTKTVIGEPCQFESCISTNLYCIWVGVDFEHLLIHIYVEYDCGGEVERDTIDCSDINVDNETLFMEYLDNLIYTYVERYS